MLSPFRRRLSAIERIQFTKNLSIMLKSGIPMGEAFDVLQHKSDKPRLVHVVRAIKARLCDGVALHMALSEHPSVFNALYVNLIRIGEESGTLEKNLDYLASYLKKKLEFHKKIIAALTYPAIVLGLTFGVSALLGVFALPKLIDLFQSLDVQLPASTRALLTIAKVMRDHGMSIVLGTIATLFAMHYLFRHGPLQRSFDTVVLRIPVFGSFLRNIEMASFCRNIGVMLQSGLPIGTALSVQESASLNLAFAGYVHQIRQGVEQGNTISTLLDHASFASFPSIAIRMIGVGEETGRLDETLLYLGEYYDEEVDTTAKNFSALVDPIVLIGVGIIVAFVALSIITPIYEFTSSIQR